MKRAIVVALFGLIMAFALGCSCDKCKDSCGTCPSQSCPAPAK
ncbi:MAG TPA: hypothetical protein PKG54_01185 [Phycisphaerae bacterium]|nr:hypothetical protein [Phycisphaerae bacterium]HQE44705.1 hypothetical protein [Phycisphaerae bacterium]